MASTETAESRSRGRAANGRKAQLEGLEREQLQQILHQMLLGRRFEERAAEAYAVGKIGGFCHLYIGQEAVAAGTMAALNPDDYVITAYREHVQALLKGISARAVMAELYGRADGCSGGRGGSMHLYSAQHHFMGGWGIVGGQIPLATGIGWAIRYKQAQAGANADNPAENGSGRGPARNARNDAAAQVCVCFMGEAAVNQGSFHESLNMAELWKLPVI